MIRRSRTGINIPDSLCTQECTDSLTFICAKIASDLIKEGKMAINAKYYRGYALDANGEEYQDVVRTLCSIYEDKCAFCESKRHNPEIEHFRPKKKVIGISGHNGYFWLSYEWTNLIPSCPDCNKIKSNHFPVSNETNRVYGPTRRIGTDEATDRIFLNSPLADEEPILLHPEFDNNVEECFAFDGLGSILSVDGLYRGSESILRYGLDRPDLKYFRQKDIDRIVENVEVAILTNSEVGFRSAINLLKNRALSTEQEYTLMHRFIFDNFEALIVPLLPLPAQHRALDLYEKIINE